MPSIFLPGVIHQRQLNRRACWYTALQMAVRFFPGQSLYLLHASEPPYAGMVDDQAKHADQHRALKAQELQQFLDSVFLPDEDRRRLVPLIEAGAPQPIIRDYAQQHEADLIVLGTRGRGAVMEAIVGSTAKSILATLPCDALVVRGPRP